MQQLHQQIWIRLLQWKAICVLKGVWLFLSDCLLIDFVQIVTRDQLVLFSNHENRWINAGFQRVHVYGQL